MGEWDRNLGGRTSRAGGRGGVQGRARASTPLSRARRRADPPRARGLGQARRLDAAAAEAAGRRPRSRALGRGRWPRWTRAPSAAGLAAAEAGAADVALGAALRAYRFDRYRTTEKPEDKPQARRRMKVLCADPAAAKAEWASRRAMAEGVFLDARPGQRARQRARPARIRRPARRLWRSSASRWRCFGPKEMREARLRRAARRRPGLGKEPRMVVMRWNGAGGRQETRPLSPSSARA